MNFEAIGHVTVNERIPSQRFHKFVDEKMKDWMIDHIHQGEQAADLPFPQTNSLHLGGTDYEVSFFDEDPLGEISCLVVVQSGDTMWRAWESADNPRSALSRSLEHLHTAEIDENGDNGDDQLPHSSSV